MVLLCTWSDEDAELTLSLSPGSPIAPAAATDAESGDVLARDDGGDIRLSMPAYGTRLISLSPEANGE